MSVVMIRSLLQVFMSCLDVCWHILPIFLDKTISSEKYFRKISAGRGGPCAILYNVLRIYDASQTAFILAKCRKYAVKWSWSPL